MTEVILLCFIALLLIERGFSQYLHQKERTYLIKTFEEEKRAVAIQAEQKVESLQQKNTDTVNTFMEETRKMNKFYSDKLSEIYNSSGPSQETQVPAGALGDMILATQETEAIEKYLRDYPESVKTFTGANFG